MNERVIKLKAIDLFNDILENLRHNINQVTVDGNRMQISKGLSILKDYIYQLEIIDDISILDWNCLIDNVKSYFDYFDDKIHNEARDKNETQITKRNDVDLFGINDQYMQYSIDCIETLFDCLETIDKITNYILLNKDKEEKQSKRNTDDSNENTLEHQGDQINPITFNELFNVVDWDKYLLVLTKSNPPLLEKNNDGSYKFIGNKKTQRGCVSQWFKFLKAKGTINRSINRDDLAIILSSNIKDYSIGGSTIDSESNEYTNKKFERQLNDLISMI